MILFHFINMLKIVLFKIKELFTFTYITKVDIKTIQIAKFFSKMKKVKKTAYNSIK